MVLRFLLPVLSAVGVSLGIYYATVLADIPPPQPAQLGLPPSSPYADAISGAGLVEASGRNIAVAAALPGVVVAVQVLPGDEVRAGAPLFRLDDRDARAQLAVQQAAVLSAGARVGEVRAVLADLSDQLQRAERLKPGVSIAGDLLDRRRFAVRTAQAQLASAEAERDRSQAMLRAAEVTLERLTVNAPSDGTVMQVNIRPGEYVVPGAAGDPPVLLGQLHPLHLRLSVDEADSWRVRPGAPATAFLRGNSAVAFPMRFVRVEPYVRPKTALTGSNAERVDTRVLELVYAFDNATGGREAMPSLYVGQQLDAFVEVATK